MASEAQSIVRVAFTGRCQARHCHGVITSLQFNF